MSETAGWGGGAARGRAGLGDVARVVGGDARGAGRAVVALARVLFQAMGVSGDIYLLCAFRFAVLKQQSGKRNF